MTTDLDQVHRARLPELRVAATPWRIRGLIGRTVVVDSRSAVLVWEPRRVTPVYAVPLADVIGEVARGGGGSAGAEFDSRPVLDPTVPFDVHTTAGVAFQIRAAEGVVDAFAPDDPLMAGRLLIDFDALDWMEEGDPVVAHPRDPYHRIDTHSTARHLVLSIDGVIVVDTVQATMLAETSLPVRWYVPRKDVLVPLETSGTVTWCAYKGRATYSSAVVGGAVVPDIAWTYSEPQRDAADVQGLLGFYAERMDATVDGEPLKRRAMTPPAEDAPRSTR